MTNLRSLSELFGFAVKLAATFAFATVMTTTATAQTNTFPTSGNAGVGTTTPSTALEVRGAGVTSRVTTTGTTGANGKFQLYSADITNNPFGEMQLYAPTGAGSEYLRFNFANSSGNVFADILTISRLGSVGIGTANPNSLLEIRRDAGGAIGPTLTLANITGGAGAGGALDFTNPGLGVPQQAQIRSSDNNDWSANLLFLTKVPGGGTNALAERMRITSSGHVGIGTTSPAALLSVSKNQASGTEIRIDNGNTAGFAGLYLNGGFAGTTGGFVQYNNVTGSKNLFVATAGSEPLYLGTDNSVRMTVLPVSGNVGIGKTDPQYRLDVVGDIKASGTIHAKYQDLAEWVPSSEQLSAGTVVVLDTTKSNQVVSSNAAYDTRVAGVISAQPGITLGESGEGKVLVATTGRVRVKVDASRGAIQIGDLLVTSDVPGVAMKSDAVNLGGVQIHRPGTIIGKALEPLEKGKSEILVLLSLQ